MNRTPATGRRLGIGSAVALSTATLWTVLLEAGVSVSAPPEWQEGTDYGAFLEQYFAWQSAILPQERGALALLCLGLLGVVVAAVRTGRGGTTTTVVASLCIGTGAALWGLVGLGEAGGRHAIDMMAASGNQIDPVNSIAFTLEITATWLFAGASALLGGGLLALGLAGAAIRRRAVCLATGLTALIFALLLFTGSDAAKYVGLVLGGVLLPLWTVSTWGKHRDATFGDREVPEAVAV